MIARILIVIGAVIVLAGVNVSIFSKENIKQNGDVIFLDLAPRDPRSLMQGDYMTLRFRLAQDIEATWRSARTQDSASRNAGGADELPREGEVRWADIVLDDRHVASLAKAGVPATLKIRYRMRKGAVWLGTNAFFFEEGSDQRYSGARYGEFRLDQTSGEAVLVGLRDAKLNAL